MVRSYLRLFRLFSRDVRLYLVTVGLFGLAATSGIQGVLLGLYLLRLGYGPAFIGTVNAVGSLASAVFCLPASTLGQRASYRKAIFYGVLLFVIGNGLLPLVEFLPDAIQKQWLLATYLLSGLGTALYIVNITPAMTSATTSQERNHVFALRIALMPFTGFVGSLIGGLLPTLMSRTLSLVPDSAAAYRYAWWAGVLLLSPALWMVAMTRKEGDALFASTECQDISTQLAFSSASPLGLILFLALVGFLRVAGEGPTRAFFNVYLDTRLHLPTAQIGALLAISRLLSIPAALVAPLAMDRWGNARTIVWGALGVSMGLLPIALIGHWAAAGLGFMAMTGLASISRTAFMVFTQEVVPNQWRGTMSAATTMAASLSWALMALGGGYLVELAGYRGMFLAGACVTAAGALLFRFRMMNDEF